MHERKQHCSYWCYCEYTTARLQNAPFKNTKWAKPPQRSHKPITVFHKLLCCHRKDSGTMVLCFLSRTVQLARHSSCALWRHLSSASTNKPLLTLFTKKPCPLCDEAKEVLEPYKKRFILQEVDISLPENSSWYEKYKYDIPVFHLNGKFLMKHRVDIKRFENHLAKLELQNDGKQ